MQDTELVVTATLYLASEDFYTSTKISSPASAGTRVLVCGQNIISTYFLTFVEPRLSSAGCLAAKTGRGEGGMLCVEK